MNKTSPEIAELRHIIEESIGRKMKTPADFIFLSGIIWERTHETMSPTTLKRLWGYIDGADTTRESTLRILSNFIGFKDWDAFLKHLSENSEVQSDWVCSPHIDVAELHENEHVEVSWKPNRHCVFRYLGEGRFIVEKAENSKLKVGNTFSCSFLILNEPLYIVNLVQGDNAPVDFVVGNKDGLCEIIKR